MNTRLLLPVALILCFASFAQETGLRPKFDEFRTTSRIDVKSPDPILSTVFQQEHRTRISKAAKLPPNFAGQLHIVEWGCGSDCVAFATIDLQTGRVYDPPFSSLWLVASEERWRGEGLKFEPDSRLLVVDGCPSRECGTFYYEWTGNEFKLLKSFKKPAEW